jgi:sugar lactone lactonase YvrE
MYRHLTLNEKQKNRTQRRIVRSYDVASELHCKLFSGTNGSALNQLSGPSSVTLDLNSSKLYIADTGNHRIMSFASGSLTGIVVAGGNGSGTLTTQLYNPSDVYFDSSSNSLFIANSGAHTIVRWVIGASFWTLVAGYAGNYGTTPFMFNNPTGLTLDSAGNLYVADTSNARVQFFLSGETNGTTIAGVASTPGNRADLLNSPRSVALDSQLNLYVSDAGNSRIQRFHRY